MLTIKRNNKKGKNQIIYMWLNYKIYLGKTIINEHNVNYFILSITNTMHAYKIMTKCEHGASIHHVARMY